MRDELLKYLFATPLMLSSALSSALGLGHIEHQSWLGEPLQANVEIIDSQNKYGPEDFRLRQVKEAEASSLGVDVVSSDYILKTTTVEHNGKLHINISTSEPVVEPFLNFMLVLEWPDGKAYREYSLLLDPAGSRIAPAQSSRSNKPAQASNPGPAFKANTAATGESQSEVVGVKSPAAPFNGASWTVRPAQTLSQIAQRIRQDQQVQLQAVSNYLYQNNPHAFAGGQHQLLVGQTLALPGADAYQAMSRRDEAQVARVNARAQAPVEPQSQQAVTDLAPQAETAPVVNYQVQAGDTLSQIAQRMRQDPNRNLQDVIDQLYRDNPQAFNGGKRGLQVGANLQLRGDAARSTAGLSYNQSDSGRLSSAPAADGLKGSDNSSAAPGTGRVRLDSNTQLKESDVLAGRLPDPSVMPLSEQIQAVGELTDKLNAENSDLRQRIDRIESSENIALLQQLVALQSKQIEHFRSQLEQTMVLLNKQQTGAVTSDSLAAVGTNAAQQNSAQGNNTANENTQASRDSEIDTDPAAQDVNEGEVDGAEVDTFATNEAQSAAEQINTSAPEQQPAAINTAASKGAEAEQKLEPAPGMSESEKALSEATSKTNELILRACLFAAALLLGVLLVRMLMRSNWLRQRFNKQAEPESRPANEPRPSEIERPAVIRVRNREPEPSKQRIEPVLMTPKPTPKPIVAAAIDPVVTTKVSSETKENPFNSGARWSHNDIPRLDVEETNHHDDAPEELPINDLKLDNDVNFDDFGLISLDDLDVNLDDGLNQDFDLDINEIEPLSKEEKKA